MSETLEVGREDLELVPGVCWSTGLLVCWFAGLLACWSTRSPYLKRKENFTEEAD